MGCYLAFEFIFNFSRVLNADIKLSSIVSSHDVRTIIQVETTFGCSHRRRLESTLVKVDVFFTT